MGFINIRQHDMSDCGPACLAMVARYYRGSVSIAKIREQTGTNSMGTSLRALSDGAASIGFKPVAIKSVENEGEDCLSEVSLPCIAHMIVDEDLLHYVVIFKIKRNTIIISDPAEGKMCIRDRLVAGSDTVSFIPNLLHKSITPF